MARQERNRMMLNTVDFKPTVFTPLERKPLDYDMGLLERSFALQDERRTKTEAQLTNIDTTLADLRSKLDPSMHQWFDDFKQTVKDDINAAIAVGDTQGALNAAIAAPRTILNNASLQYRLKATEDYNKKIEQAKKDLESGKITGDTYDWVIDTHKFDYKETIDDNGKIINHTDYSKDNFYVQDMTNAELTEFAFKLISPYSNTYDDGTTSTRTDRVTAESIQKNIKDLLNDSRFNKPFNQKYQVDKWKYIKLRDTQDRTPDQEQEFKELRGKYVNDAGNIISKEEYLEDMLYNSNILKNRAYNNTHTNKTKNTSSTNGEYTIGRIAPDSMLGSGTVESVPQEMPLQSGSWEEWRNQGGRKPTPTASDFLQQ
jgi:hypothetical protein